MNISRVNIKFTSIKVIIYIIILSILSSCSVNQGGIILKHSLTNDEVSLREKRTVLKTIEDKMIYGRIIDVKNNQLLIEQKRSGDTLTYSKNDIKTIQVYFIEDTSSIELFAWLGIGAVLGLALIPVAWIDDGWDEAKNGLAFMGTLGAVSGTMVYTGSINDEYDLSHDWNIEKK